MTDRQKLQEILDCPMGDNDADADTVGQYLLTLAREVWVENEGFSGKRPFGNSGWDWEIYRALTGNNLMKYTNKTVYDDEDFAEYDWDYAEQRKIDSLLIEALNRAKIVVE